MRAEPMTFCFTIWWNLSWQSLGFTPPFVPTLSPQPRHPSPQRINLPLTNIKPGNEQRDYVTVNYSLTLKLLQRLHKQKQALLKLAVCRKSWAVNIQYVFRTHGRSTFDRVFDVLRDLRDTRLALLCLHFLESSSNVPCSCIHNISVRNLLKLAFINTIEIVLLLCLFLP